MERSEEDQKLIVALELRRRELEETLKIRESKIKELVDLNFRLATQRDCYFEAKETLRGALAGLSNPFR